MTVLRQGPVSLDVKGFEAQIEDKPPMLHLAHAYRGGRRAGAERIVDALLEESTADPYARR